MADVDQLSYLPANVRASLKPFQREGILFALKKRGRCLIADEMGLGKTIQALCVAYFYRAEWPVLVIVPASLKYSWVEELERWFPDVGPHQVRVINNTSDAENLTGCQVIIVSYGLLQIQKADSRLMNALHRQQCFVVVCDESHQFRNEKTARTQAVSRLVSAAHRRLFLSGTPALSRPVELFQLPLPTELRYPQLSLLAPERFGNRHHFLTRYCDAHERYIGRGIKKWDYSGASHLDELNRTLLSTVMVRRLKRHVLSQLPPKVRQRIPFELTGESACLRQINELFGAMRANCDGDVNKLMDTMVFNPEHEPSPTGSYEARTIMLQLFDVTAKAKTAYVKKYIELHRGEKMLVFAHHLHMIDSLKRFCQEENIGYIAIDGRVPSSERHAFVQRFQTDGNVRVAILGIKAAGQGITLNRASLVVFAELYWNPGDMEQCEDRAHRIGQTDTVMVHYLIAKGTADELLWQHLLRKTRVVSSALNGVCEELQAATQNRYTSQLNECEVSYAADCSVLGINPPAINPTELSQLLNSQRPAGQRDIRDYFRPIKKKPDVPSPASAETTAQVINIDCNDEENNMDVLEDKDCRSPDLFALDEFKEQPFKSLSAPVLGENDHQRRNDEPAAEKASSQPSSFDNEDLSFDESFLKHLDDFERQVEQTTTTASSSSVAGADSSSMWYCVRCARINSLPLSTCQHCRIKRWLNNNADADNDDDGQPANQPAAVPSYKQFYYRLSRYSERVFLYWRDCSLGQGDGQLESLNCCFLVDDVLANQTDVLPDVLGRNEHNLSIARAFCKQFASLEPTKQFMLRRHGQPLLNPVLTYTELAQARRANAKKQRYRTRDQLNEERIKQVAEIGGAKAVRVAVNAAVKRRKKNVALAADQSSHAGLFTSRKKELITAYWQSSRCDTGALYEQCSGVELARPLQIVLPTGQKACMECGSPCLASLVDGKTGQSEDANETSDATQEMAFCSDKCRHEYLVQGSGSYLRRKMFEIERGVCRICGVDAEHYFRQVSLRPYFASKWLRLREDFAPKVQLTAKPERRVDLIKSSPFGALPKRLIKQMTLNPTAGQFWQVDHILPVYAGGGQCDVDNLRTLCAICHRKVTARQARSRAVDRRVEKTLVNQTTLDQIVSSGVS